MICLKIKENPVYLIHIHHGGADVACYSFSYRTFPAFLHSLEGHHILSPFFTHYLSVPFIEICHQRPRLHLMLVLHYKAGLTGINTIGIMQVEVLTWYQFNTQSHCGFTDVKGNG